MSYRALRKDLTETTKKCDFCAKHLTSLKAYILVDVATGALVYAGPICAKHHIEDGQSLSGIPDLTTFTLATQKNEGRSAGGSGGGRRGADNEPEQRAIAYLMLREYKLSEELNCSYKVLSHYYDKWAADGLSAEEVTHINNIEAKAPASLSLSSLQRIYNYLFWIDVGIDKLPSQKRAFLTSVPATLIRCGKLSEKQKAAVNHWLEHIDGVPQLK